MIPGIFVTFYILFGLLPDSESLKATNTEYLTEPKIIYSPGYPDKYPEVCNFTWVWTKQRGFWGLHFKYVDLNPATDHITVFTGSDPKYPPIIIRENHSRLYTRDSHLRIEFLSNTTQPRSGFVISVLYGLTAEDLDKQFLSFVTPPPPKTDDNSNKIQVIPILFAVLITVALLASLLLLVVWAISRRRPRQHQAISLNVNVHGINIRRESGIKHTRKTPSQSDSEDSFTANVSQPISSMGQGSCTVRTQTDVTNNYLSPVQTSTIVQTTEMVNVDADAVVRDARAVPNTYAPLESIFVSFPQSGGKTRRLTGRAHRLQLTMPKSQPDVAFSGFTDDGYMRMDSPTK